MILGFVDWLVIGVYFLITLLIGIYASKKNKSSTDFFTGSANIPWIFLGISMVATTFSSDTPNLVTDIVRKNGVSGNWAWWAFLISGMLTVFIYARLWKRSGVLTDIEFYELRYSGKAASFLRGFRAIYLGLFFNVMIMSVVCLAGIKIGSILLGLKPVETLMISGVITMIYSTVGGLRGVVLTDVVQFIISLAGSFIAAYYAISHPNVGGLTRLLDQPEIQAKTALLPSFDNPELLLSIFLIPVLVQWWSLWYPGSEPGGGGYIAQRMFAAKNETSARKAVLFFNIAHYAIRPWPWILVALASILVYPDLDSLKTAFPESDSVVGDDLAYPAMLTFIPKGLIGLVAASLIAAFMSTLSTHLNWGASYLTNDVYKRFIAPESSEKTQLRIGQFSTVILMILAMLFSLVLESALDGFQILLQIGAGTGLIFLLRWFWMRINAAAEIAAMIVSFIVAVFFKLIYPRIFIDELKSWQELCIGVGITTAVWIITAFITKPTDKNVIDNFKRVTKYEKVNLKYGIICSFLGAISIYSALFTTGKIIYGEYFQSILLSLVTVVSLLLLGQMWKKLDLES